MYALIMSAQSGRRGGGKRPEAEHVEPFKTVLSGDRAAIAKVSMPDLEHILAVTDDDGTCEYAYGPASKVGNFSDVLMAEAKKRG